MAERRAGDPRHQDVTGRDAGKLAFAVHHHGAARAPADARRMPIETRMLEPDLVRHYPHSAGWGQRARLQQLEAAVVERPFDLDRHAKHGFGLAQQAAEYDGFARAKARVDGKLPRPSPA